MGEEKFNIRPLKSIWERTSYTGYVVHEHIRRAFLIVALGFSLLLSLPLLWDSRLNG
jgi:hypothetical protein